MRRPADAPRLPARPLDGTHDPIASSGAEGNEFPIGAFEREAMLVLAARGIGPQRRHANAVFHFHGRSEPGSRASRRIPEASSARYASDSLSCTWARWRISIFSRSRRAVRAAIAPAPADPGQARASPDHAEVRLAVAVCAARVRDAFLDGGGRFMRFSCDLDHVTWMQGARFAGRGKFSLCPSRMRKRSAVWRSGYDLRCRWRSFRLWALRPCRHNPEILKIWLWESCWWRREICRILISRNR